MIVKCVKQRLFLEADIHLVKKMPWFVEPEG